MSVTLTTPSFICYTEYVVGSGHPGGYADVANRAASTLWSNQSLVAADLNATDAEIAAARENGVSKAAASLLTALAQRMDDKINNAVMTGGLLTGVSGTSVQVTPLTAYIYGRYQETTANATVTGLTAGSLNYIYMLSGASLSPSFGADTNKATASAIYLGEVNLSASTSVNYAAKGRFSTSWMAINNTTSMKLAVSHALGFVPEPHQMGLLFTDNTIAASGTTFVPNHHHDNTGGAGVWIESITSLTLQLQAGNCGMAYLTSAGVPSVLASGFVKFFARRENGTLS